ncbi:hypothetical protein D1872_280840 [compost metagenome]
MYLTLAVDRQICNLIALLLQTPAGMQNRMMLDRRRNNMTAAILPRFRRAEQSQIIALRSAARKHELVRTAADQSGQPVPRPVHESLGGAAVGMDARSVPVLLAHDGDHRLRHFRMNGCGSRVVQIYGFHSMASHL